MRRTSGHLPVPFYPQRRTALSFPPDHLSAGIWSTLRLTYRHCSRSSFLHRQAAMLHPDRDQPVHRCTVLPVHHSPCACNAHQRCEVNGLDFRLDADCSPLCSDDGGCVYKGRIAGIYIETDCLGAVPSSFFQKCFCLSGS